MPYPTFVLRLRAGAVRMLNTIHEHTAATSADDSSQMFVVRLNSLANA